MSFLSKFRPTSFRLSVSTSHPTESPPIPTVKLVTVGESSVGKSSIISRMVCDTFKDNDMSTIGGAFCMFTQKRNNKQYKFHLWDTAGQERFRSLVPMYIKNAKIVLIVFDITNMGSFKKVEEHWYDFVTDFSPDATKILIGSKSDLKDCRAVPISDAKQYATSKGILYIECSAKNNSNISELVELFIKNVDTNINNYSIDRVGNNNNNNNNNNSIDRVGNNNNNNNNGIDRVGSEINNTIRLGRERMSRLNNQCFGNRCNE